MMQAHAVAVGNTEVAPSPFAPSEAVFRAATAALESPGAFLMTHSDVEREVESLGQELMRQLFQDHLSLRSQRARELGVEGPVVGADGVVRTDLRDHERLLMSIHGEVRLERVGHHAPGTSSLHPLDAALNLPPTKFSLGLRRRLAEEVAKVSYDEALQSIRAHTGARISKRQAEEELVRAAVDFDAFYQGREGLAAAAVTTLGSLLVLTTDAKGIVMRLAALREATRRAALRGKGKRLKHRLRKGEKRNRKRMAQVAAVYTVAPFVRTPEEILQELDREEEKAPRPRPKPEHKRVWASPEKEPEEVIRGAFEEALRRDPERRKTWVALSDGNEEQLWLLEKLALEYGVTLTIVLDVIHVAEYLWRATTSFNKEGTAEAEAWVRERLLAILQGKASDVAAGVRRSATLRKLLGGPRKAADKCANYLLKYVTYLHYDQYLARGFPIATGIIEGACRHLVKDRMDITGARWGLDGAEAVLRLRSLRSSGDFDEYWAFHEREELGRNHAELYVNGEIPAMRQPVSRALPGRSHLRLVK
jgi:hypothetical protein